MKVLHIDSSILSDNSVSRQLTVAGTITVPLWHAYASFSRGLFMLLLFFLLGLTSDGWLAANISQ